MAPLAARAGYRVERVGTETALACLQSQWTRLLAEMPDAAISLTWEWASTWLRNREPEWEPWVLAVYDRQEDLAGIAPWARIKHQVGPLRVQRLAFIGDHRAYRTHMDVIARPADKPAVFSALLAYLDRRRGTWDVLDLEALAEGSPVESRLAAEGGHHFVVEREICPMTLLPGTWEEYERRQLSSDYRWQLRNRRRKLEKAYPGAVTFRRVRDAGELPAAMSALAELHQKRWHGKGQGSSFDHASFTAFHRDLAALALERDWLRLYLICVGDQVIAAEYAFLYRGVLTGYSTAFDMDYGDYNPGQLILSFMIQDAIAEGVRELDLGRGTFDYKFRWTDRQRVDSHLQLAGTASGYLWAGGRALARKAMAIGRKHVPESLRERINRRQLRSKPASPPG